MCGGLVRPIDDQSIFGYCEKCGVVYALKERLSTVKGAEAPARLDAENVRQTKVADAKRAGSVADAATSLPSTGSYWRCPDCDAEIRTESDSDLEFVRREHIREYHPNRSTP